MVQLFGWPHGGSLDMVVMQGRTGLRAKKLADSFVENWLRSVRFPEFPSI